MKQIETMKAINMTVDKYLESTEPERNGAPLDEEDTPIVGIFNNGMVIINHRDGETKIEVKGGKPLKFDLDIMIFGPEEDINE